MESTTTAKPALSAEDLGLVTQIATNGQGVCATFCRALKFPLGSEGDRAALAKYYEDNRQLQEAAAKSGLGVIEAEEQSARSDFLSDSGSAEKLTALGGLVSQRGARKRAVLVQLHAIQEARGRLVSKLLDSGALHRVVGAAKAQLAGAIAERVIAGRKECQDFGVHYFPCAIVAGLVKTQSGLDAMLANTVKHRDDAREIVRILLNL